MSRSVLASLAAAAALAGCASNPEKIVELRTDLRDRMDVLYDRYGGGGLVRQAKTDAEKENSQAADTAARFLGEMDRSYFQSYCLAHGRGERLITLSDKLDGFMKEPANREACREAARLDTRIRALEERASRQ